MDIKVKLRKKIRRSILIILIAFAVEGCGNETLKTGEIEKNFEKVESTVDDKKDFYGIWHIDKVALCSEQYTGSIEDGDFEENLFDPADFIGMEIEYRKDYFRLGDKTYTSPEYILTNVEVKDVNEGGKFRNPDLYEFIQNEKIEIAGAEKGNYLSETLLTQVEVKFNDETKYGDYNFIPVGTQIYVLNENAILIGIWGKILFAYRIK